MTTGKEHTRKVPASIYKLLVVAAAIIWGLAFVLMKNALDVMPSAYLLGFRFTATGIILAIVFMKHIRKAINREHAVYGSLLGVMLFSAFWAQTTGLASTTPGKNAFLTASYVVLVPFICWFIIRKKPRVHNILAALLCVIGMGLVSLQGSFTMEFGDIITIVGALLFGVHIVFVSRWSEGRDIFTLTVFQFLAAGACGLLFGGLFETLPPLSALLEPVFIMEMAYLVVFASCLALVFQNIALAHVPPAQVSLLLSLEAVFGVVFSVLLYQEALTFRLLAGFSLIFAAILVSELFPLKKQGQEQIEAQEAEKVLVLDHAEG